LEERKLGEETKNSDVFSFIRKMEEIVSILNPEKKMERKLIKLQFYN